MKTKHLNYHSWDISNRSAALREKRDAMISSVAETVAKDWYRRAIMNPVKMTLFWRQPRDGENAACPIIDIENPNDSAFVADSVISPAMTLPQVHALVADRMNNLPMLRPSFWYV